ncbi:MAG: AraC family transcriptional regulator [Chitinophagaceae bacterium]|nr:MAG: AraC family transcriptional regulator [Chitinophagaceae bacterium]
MAVKNYLNKIDLTNPRYLQTLVENRRVFNLQNCELNVFESYQQSFLVPLTFNDLVITSMVRGKKVMHLPEKPSFDYLPGETVIASANEQMLIDFPEANIENPTQCIALAVDASYINGTVNYLNEYYNSGTDEKHDWKLMFNQYHFDNDNEVTELINKLIRVCSSPDKGKSIYADLSLKELLIRLIQSQHLNQVSHDTSNTNQSRLHYVLNYISQNLTEKIAIDTLSRKAYLSRNMFFKIFKEQFGISPLEYINRERIRLAKILLAEPNSTVTDVSMRCGFSDTNYFVRLFKKSEGITPGMYRSAVRNSVH